MRNVIIWHGLGPGAPISFQLAKGLPPPPEMRKLDKTETLVTIGDMTNAREVTEIDFYNYMCLYFQFDLIRVFSEFV